jgi:hypothetical protein
MASIVRVMHLKMKFTMTPRKNVNTSAAYGDKRFPTQPPETDVLNRHRFFCILENEHFELNNSARTAA